MTTFLEAQDAALHDDFLASKYRNWSKIFLNEAVGLIYRKTSLARGDVVFSATLGIGDSGEDLLAEGVKVQSVLRQDNGDPLLWLDRAEFEQLSNELVSQPGPPVYYTIKGDGTATTETTHIEVLPAPEQAYTLDVVARFAPAQMSGDSEVVPLPPDYSYYPVRYARSKLFALEDDDQMSAFWNGEWLACLMEIRQDMQTRRVGPRQTPSMWEGLTSGPRFHHPQGLF